jgi:hypothetical protein
MGMFSCARLALVPDCLPVNPRTGYQYQAHLFKATSASPPHILPTKPQHFLLSGYFTKFSVYYIAIVFIIIIIIIIIIIMFTIIITQML